MKDKKSLQVERSGFCQIISQATQKFYPHYKTKLYRVCAVSCQGDLNVGFSFWKLQMRQSSIVYIRTVSSWCLLPTFLNWFKKDIGHLSRATLHITRLAPCCCRQSNRTVLFQQHSRSFQWSKSQFYFKTTNSNQHLC